MSRTCPGPTAAKWQLQSVRTAVVTETCVLLAAFGREVFTGILFVHSWAGNAQALAGNHGRALPGSNMQH